MGGPPSVEWDADWRSLESNQNVRQPFTPIFLAWLPVQETQKRSLLSCKRKKRKKDTMLRWHLWGLEIKFVHIKKSIYHNRHLKHFLSTCCVPGTNLPLGTPVIQRERRKRKKKSPGVPGTSYTLPVFTNELGAIILFCRSNWDLKKKKGSVTHTGSQSWSAGWVQSRALSWGPVSSSPQAASSAR